MKKLVLITGAPGIGKTTVCRELFKTIEGCAWLDSDWCWMVNPWVSKTNEQKKSVEDTFIRILREYLVTENIETVLFSWVLSSDYMFDIITNPLSDLEFDVIKIALVCDKEQYINRMRLDGRRDEQINYPDSMDKYMNLKAIVIDVTNLAVAEITTRMLQIINSNK